MNLSEIYLLYCFILLCKPPGVKTFCDATQEEYTARCFGSLGGTLEVKLPNSLRLFNYGVKRKKILIELFKWFLANLFIWGGVTTPRTPFWVIAATTRVITT